MFTFTENKQTEPELSYKKGLSKIANSFAVAKEFEQQQKEELHDFRLSVFDNPMKYVDGIIAKLPNKIAEGSTFYQSINTFGQGEIVAKQNGKELLALIEELKEESRLIYSRTVQYAFYNPDKKMESELAMQKYQEFTKCIDKLNKAL